MTRQAHVLLFVLTIFISSLPRERYSVTSCGGMVHLPLFSVYCRYSWSGNQARHA